MDIWLSVNNRQEVMRIPVMPSSFTVSKSYNNTTFETMSGAEMLLMGKEKLKTINWDGFFPAEKNKARYDNMSYLKNSDMWGWDYVYKLDTWYAQKLPIRLVITYEHSDTPINIAVTIESFSYEVKTDGDLWYSISFKQVNMLGHDNIIPWYDEEEIDLEELEKLRLQVENLTAIVQDLANPFIYNYIDDNMPEWAREAVQAAVNAKILSGDENGLNLKYDDLRHLTMLHRAGVF